MCLINATLLAFGTPGLRSVFIIRCFGIEPEPKASGSSGEPNSSACTISLVVSLETPPAHAVIGFVNTLPFHHLGYIPVRW